MSIVTDVALAFFNGTCHNYNMSKDKSNCALLSDIVHYYNVNLRFLISLIIVIMGGVIGNAVIIAVLKRARTKSPFISILKALAWTHLLSQLGRIPYILVLHNFESKKDCQFMKLDFIIPFAMFVKMLFYMTAMYLTLVMAIWRYLAVTYPLKIKCWCTRKRTHFAIYSSFLFSLLVTLYELAVVAIEGASFEFQSVSFKYTMLMPPLFLNMCISSVIVFFCYKLMMSIVKARKNSSQLNNDGKDRIKATSVSLFVMYFFVLFNLLKGFLELSFILDEDMLENNCKVNLIYISQFLQTTDTSCDFLVYYLFNYKTFRRETHSIIGSIRVKIVNFICFCTNSTYVAPSNSYSASDQIQNP